jgi:hypothetical protein
MSPKRDPNDSVRMTIYLSTDAHDALTHYIDENYSAWNAYGITSHIVDKAVMCYCSNANMSTACLDTEVMELPKDVACEEKPEG